MPKVIMTVSVPMEEFITHFISAYNDAQLEDRWRDDNYWEENIEIEYYYKKTRAKYRKTLVWSAIYDEWNETFFGIESDFAKWWKEKVEGVEGVEAKT